jgi:hypothetical protein
MALVHLVTGLQVFIFAGSEQILARPSAAHVIASAMAYLMLHCSRFG